MRVSVPCYVDFVFFLGNIVEVTTVTVLSLTTIWSLCSILNVDEKNMHVSIAKRNGARPRAFGMLFIHISSLGYGVSIFFEVFVRWSHSGDFFCHLFCYSGSITWSFFRVSVLLLYFQRLDVLIQSNIYMPWVRRLCCSLGCICALGTLAFNIIATKPHFNEDKCEFDFTMEHPNFKMWRTYLYAGGCFVQVIPSIVYLALFIYPICKYSPYSNEWRTTIHRHLVITVTALCIDVTSIIITSFQDLSTEAYCAIILCDVFLCNILLLFIYTDWKSRVLPCCRQPVRKPDMSNIGSVSFDYHKIYNNTGDKHKILSAVSSITIPSSLLDSPISANILGDNPAAGFVFSECGYKAIRSKSIHENAQSSMIVQVNEIQNNIYSSDVPVLSDQCHVEDCYVINEPLSATYRSKLLKRCFAQNAWDFSPPVYVPTKSCAHKTISLKPRV